MADPNDLNSVFTQIYLEKRWGWHNMTARKNTKFYSGGGTDPDNDTAGAYIKLLQSFIAQTGISTVVEIGCGDWEISNQIDWGSADYTGYDVFEAGIAYNVEHFSRPGVRFVCADAILETEIQADFLIVKDVFQHLPPSYCKDFVKAIPRRFRHNLITNDLGGNTEIEFGGYSGNDFSAHPFFMRSQLLLQWNQKSPAAGNKQTITLLP